MTRKSRTGGQRRSSRVGSCKLASVAGGADGLAAAAVVVEEARAGDAEDRAGAFPTGRVARVGAWRSGGSLGQLLATALEMLAGDGASVVEGGRDEGVVGVAVDLPGQAAGDLEEGLLGGRRKQRELAAGQAEAVGEIGLELVAVEAGPVLAHDEPLGEGFVDGHGEAAAQLGEADEQQAQAVLGVHLEIGEQAQILEHVVAQVVRLVDDEHGELLALADEARKLGADLAVGGGAGAHGGEAELPGDRLVGVEHGSGRKRHVIDAVQAGMQGGGDAAADAGLAAADLAGEQADAAQFEQMLEARRGLAGGAGGEQLVGVGGMLEGEVGEGEVGQVQQSCSWQGARSSRRRRGGGRRRGRGIDGLVGPIGAALGSPPGWLDDLDPSEAINTILTATALLPPEDLEEALSAWDGLDVADE